MKALMKRSMALLLALILIVGFVPATIFTANAATVDYKYSGNYIYNWGTREVVATFLSPNAEAFYDENNVSYYELAALSGSATDASVPGSDLYKELQSIMADAHTTETSYDGTRDLFQYTDCEKNGSPAEISAFYSGQAVGPAWDGGSTWNREHTWPNSKGDMAGNGENDIMMLRPASKSVNSSRGNEAYGEGTDYYDPNSVSEGKYDIRGDVARIVLYVYVRWGCTNTGSEYNTTDIFGTKGVIESKERLLEWMEEDPVDTWEMGRNDSVESITGTRNIFVDYPELAFELFEEDVPNMQTPSGIAMASAYNITAQSGNDAHGSVSVSGNVITATPNEGYEVSGYQVVSGTATVIQNGNTFTVYPTSDCTIQINFIVGNGDQPATVTTVDRTYTFSDYTAGTQYAENEEHLLDSDVAMVTTQCHFTSELRIYSSSTHNGYAVVNSALPIAGLKFNAGDNADSVVVYGSNDGGNTWMEIATQKVTSTYTDYTIDFVSNTYTSLKLDVVGSNQVRLKNITLTLVTGDSESCDHTNIVPVGEAIDATCTTTGMTAGEKCGDCDKVITEQEETPVTDHSYVDGICVNCGASNTTVDLSGDYYFAAIRSSGNYFYMTNDLGTAKTKRYQAVDSGLTELPAAITSPTNSNVFTLKLQADGTYKICAKYVVGDNYLGWTSGNSGLLVAEDSALSLTVTAAGTEGAYNIFFDERYLSLNNQSGSNYFAFYAGTQINDLFLIPVEETGDCQHTNTTVTGKVDATCTEDGYTGDTVCSDCDAIVEYGNIVKASGHSYVDGTCQICGEAENSVVTPEIPEDGVYKLVTDIDEVKNGGKFVIVANVDGEYYAMGNSLSSSKLNSVEVNVFNGMVYSLDAPTWTIGAYSGSVVLTDGTEYLKHSSSTDLSTVTEVFPWTVTAVGTGYNLISSTDDARALSFRANGSNVFGAYALSNNNKGEYFADLQLYKLVEGELPEVNSTLSFCENGQTTITATPAVESAYTMPGAVNAAPEGYTFVGWVKEQELDETSIKPENVLEAGSEYTVGGDTVFYALYSITKVIEGDKVYQLVTDASTLAAGDKIVIAASEYTYAISTTQNKNNRGQAIIVKNGTTITFGDDVQVLTLETGNVTGTFAFNTGSGYLYAASSSSNYLRTKTALDDNGSWMITITNGTTSVVAQGTNIRNVMQYNQGNSLFACYESASQKAVALYKETVDTTVTAYYTTCVHNIVTDEAVAATDSEDGLTAGEHCSICGKVFVAQEVIPCLVGKVENWNITLKDDLSVNFYLFVNDSVKDNAQLQVNFYGKTETKTAEECYDDTLDAYVVRVDAAAAQMMDDIVVQITDGDEKIVTKTYTIRQYADYILESDLEEHIKYHPMVREMLNYGAKAQTYFEYNEGNPANKDITGVGTQAVPENAPLDKDISGSTEGITFYGATLVFRNKIALRYYFQPEDINTAYTFTVNGDPYMPQKKQGLLYIEIPGITPDRLDEQYSVSVKTAEDQGELTVSYGPMNYLVNMNSKGSVELKALVQALYNYHLAAKALTQE